MDSMSEVSLAAISLRAQSAEGGLHLAILWVYASLYKRAQILMLSVLNVIVKQAILINMAYV